MLNSLTILKQARELGYTGNLATIETEIANIDYNALKQAERANYTVVLYDKVSQINGIEASVILKDAPSGGEIYLIYVNGNLQYLQKHDPEQAGLAPMDEATALLRAETTINAMIEQKIAMVATDTILRAIL